MRYLKWARYACVFIVLAGFLAMVNEEFRQISGDVGVYTSIDAYGMANSPESALVIDPIHAQAVSALERSYADHQAKNLHRVYHGEQAKRPWIRPGMVQNGKVSGSVQYFSTGSDIHNMISYLIAENLRLRVMAEHPELQSKPVVCINSGSNMGSFTWQGESWKLAMIFAFLLLLYLYAYEAKQRE